MSAGRLSHFAGAFDSPAETRRWAVRVAVLIAATYLSGRVAAALPALGGNAPLIWTSAGIAIAGLLRFGVAAWPGVWLGTFLVLLATGVPPWLAALLAVGHSFGPVLGVLVLRREGMHLELDRRLDLWLFVAVGVAFSMAVTATNSAFWLAAGGRLTWAESPQALMSGWVGGSIGALVLGIPLLTLSPASWRQASADRRWVPTLLLSMGTIAAAATAFAGSTHERPIQSPLFFLPHVLLCWLAARSGLFAASLNALLLTVLTVATTLSGVGPFQMFGTGAGADLAMLAGYVASLVAIPLFTTGLTGEFAARERRWKLALDTSRIGVGEWDLKRDRFELSPRWLALLGHARQDFGHDLESFWSRVHPDDLRSTQWALDPLRSGRQAECHVECRLRCRDGSWRPFELHALVTERGADGASSRVLATARDVTALRAARDSEQLTQSALKHLHEGLLITDARHRVLEANPTYVEICGHSREELLATVPSLLRPAEPGSRAAAQQAAMSAALAVEGVWRGEMRDLRRNGESCLLQVTASAVRNGDGSVRNHVYAVADITQARQQLEQLQRQAHFDELTHLPNRVRLAQMLDEALRTSRQEGSLLTVCYLDLDHFKPVNDQFGHDAGDRLLLELAVRMRRSLRSWAGGDDVVARIGGDEFVLLLRTATLEESRHAVERVLSQVCQPYALGVGAGPVMVTASIGATVFPLDGADPETLLRHADHAMYGAKQAGRNGYLFFDAEHDRRTEARFVALGRVQEALDADEFRLYFQPKVDMRSGAVLGVEALLRWQHPDKGVISPAQFLPLIENTGLSGSVGNWVLRRGIEQLAQWLRQGLDLTVSINVSARHLQEPQFAQHLAGLLARHQAPVARRLILEVLETAALADIDYTCALMVECRALGVRFALDDFGTGYSTFTYLKRLPIDMLKIDRSFVTNMLSDRHDLAIVEGVIGLSQTFGCTVVAEGVETPEQAQRLIEIGCDVGQGNGIAAAMPAGEVLDWVQGYAGLTRDTALQVR